MLERTSPATDCGNALYHCRLRKKTRRLGYNDLQNWISVTTVCPTTFKNIKTANSQQYFPIDKKFASVTVCANKNNFPEKAYFQLFSR